MTEDKNKEHKDRKKVSDEELERRRSQWQRPEPYASKGMLAKYARLVSSASEGAVTDKF